MLRVYKKLTRRTRIIDPVALDRVLSGNYHPRLLSIPIRSDTLKAKVIALLTDELESEVTIETPRGSGLSARSRQRQRAW